MSIIFGFPNTKGVKVSEYLSAQGINLLRCTMSSFEALVTIRSNQPAYRNYTSYLPAYMSAYNAQKRVSIISPYHPLSYDNTKPLVTSRFPNLSVSFPTNPPAEILDFMHSEGGSELNIKGKKVFLIPDPSSGTIRKIAAAGAIRTSPAAINSVNIECLSSLSLIRRIFSNFFLTHQYPAFIDSDHIQYNEEHWKTDRGLRKREREEDNDDEGPSRKKRRQEGTEEDGSDDDTENMETDRVLVPTGDRIVWALPPPVIHHGWGTVQDIPEGDGIFIRYVEETQNNDRERMVEDVLLRYFVGCLGNNADAVRTTYAKLKSDMGIISMTSVGKELAHLAKCIDLGLQSQARIFPLLDAGQYLGCALIGAGFQISAYGTVYAPVPSSTLLEKVQLAGSHKSCIKAIADIVDDDAMSRLHQDIEGSQSMIKLRSLLIETSLSQEDRDRICTLARGLRYQSKSLNVSAANITSCLTLISNPEADLPEYLPISPSRLFEVNRLALIWSAFGDLAPTCQFPGGPLISLETTKNLPKHVGFRMVPLKDALLDLDSIITRKGFFNCTLNRRSSVFKDRIYQNVEASQIIAALSAACGVSPGAGPAHSGTHGNVAPDLFDDGF